MTSAIEATKGDTVTFRLDPRLIPTGSGIDARKIAPPTVMAGLVPAISGQYGPRCRCGRGAISRPVGSKAELTALATRDHRSLGELLRELATQCVQQERRRAFEVEARRQSMLIAARARDPNSDENKVMRWIEGVADPEAWKP